MFDKKVFKGLKKEDQKLALEMAWSDYNAHEKTKVDEFLEALIISVDILLNINKKKDAHIEAPK